MAAVAAALPLTAVQVTDADLLVEQRKGLGILLSKFLRLNSR